VTKLYLDDPKQGWDDWIKRRDALSSSTLTVTQRLEFGEGEGHPFRGNQWTTGESGGEGGRKRPGPETFTEITEGNAESRFQHKDANGHYTPEREALHRSIIEEQLAGHSRSSDLTFHFMGGGPGTGKSSLLEQGLIATPPDAATVSADDAKERLPEYKELIAAGRPDLASAYVHEESSDIAHAIVTTAYDRGLNIVLDGCGDSEVEKLAGKVEKAREAGYTVEMTYATRPTEDALKSAHIRAAETGRSVPDGDLRASHATVSRTAVAALAAGVFDRIQVYDVEKIGSPMLLAHGDRSGYTVDDQVGFDRFVAKGWET
jgi:predicted ABC-type ATPase